MSQGLVGCLAEASHLLAYPSLTEIQATFVTDLGILTQQDILDFIAMLCVPVAVIFHYFISRQDHICGAQKYSFS